MTEINPTMGYRPDIQALRGLAVLVVVAYHAGLPVRGGFVGVDIFFVISGYVISQLVFVRFQDNRFSFRQFFERRILRLVPLLTLVNLATVLISLIAFNPFGEFQQVTEAMKFATFFSANYYFFTSNDYLELAYHPLRHLWSLAVEEQFYLVFPFLLIGLFALAKRLRSSVLIPAMFLVFGGVSLFLCLNATRNPLDSEAVRLAFFAPHLRAWEFLAGGLAFFLVQRGVATLKVRGRGVIAIVGFALVLIGVLFIDTPNAYPNWKTIAPVVGTAMMLFAGSGANVVSHLFSHKYLVWLGDVSYGWYLWHWPLVVFFQGAISSNVVSLVAASLIALGLSVVSLKFFENPIRYSTKLKGIRSWLVLAVCMTVSVSAIVTLNRVAETGLGLAVEDTESLLVSLDNCRGRAIVENLDKPCSNDVVESDKLILLLGDSQAHSASDGLFKAAHDLGIHVIAFQADGCPMSARTPIAVSNWCRDVQRAYLDSVALYKPDVVVIVNRYDLYVNTKFSDSENDLRFASSDGSFPKSRDEQMTAVIDSLSDQVEAVRGLGSKVVLMLETPTVVMPAPNILSKVFSPVRSSELRQAIRWNEVRDEIADRIIERFSGMADVVIADPAEGLCPTYPECFAVSGGNVTHWEKQHLNRVGSLNLVPFWSEVLGELAGTTGD